MLHQKCKQTAPAHYASAKIRSIFLPVSNLKDRIPFKFEFKRKYTQIPIKILKITVHRVAGDLFRMQISQFSIDSRVLLEKILHRNILYIYYNLRTLVRGIAFYLIHPY